MKINTCIGRFLSRFGVSLSTVLNTRLWSHELGDRMAKTNNGVLEVNVMQKKCNPISAREPFVCKICQHHTIYIPPGERKKQCISEIEQPSLASFTLYCSNWLANHAVFYDFPASCDWSRDQQIFSYDIERSSCRKCIDFWHRS